MAPSPVGVLTRTQLEGLTRDQAITYFSARMANQRTAILALPLTERLRLVADFLDHDPPQRGPAIALLEHVLEKVKAGNSGTEAEDELIEIEGDEIVIRVPISSIPAAAEVAFERAYGFEAHDFVVDAAVFAREMLAELRREQEDGTTPVHLLLDEAAVSALENGAAGVRGGSNITRAFSARSCRVCGCTDEDCRVCIERAGEHGVEPVCAVCGCLENPAGLAERGAE